MQEAFIDICGVPTKVVTWGRWIEETNNEDNENIVLCIPGNPGVVDFYKCFLQTIYEKLGYTVWVLSHAGHDLPENKNLWTIPTLEENKGLYGLKGQILHKKVFIEKYVPKNAKIHFIGHSIGTYIILHLLKDPLIKARTVKSYLLFPTFEHMAETLNGMFLIYIIRPIVWFILFLVRIFMILPIFIQDLLIRIYVLVTFADKLHLETIRKFINTDTLSRVFYMGMQEMELVRDRDTETLQDNCKQIKLFYGANDNWAPVSYCKNLKEDIPGIDAEICKDGYSHAFVLRNSKQMGLEVANWMQN